MVRSQRFKTGVFVAGFGTGEDGVLHVAANASHTLNSGRWYNFREVRMEEGSELKVASYSDAQPDGGVLLLRVQGEVVIGKGAFIDLNGCGFKGGQPVAASSQGHGL